MFKNFPAELAVSGDDSIAAMLSYWEGECKNNPDMRVRFEFVLAEEIKKD